MQIENIEIFYENEELTKILTRIWGGMSDYEKYSETEVKLLPSEMNFEYYWASNAQAKT